MWKGLLADLSRVLQVKLNKTVKGSRSTEIMYFFYVPLTVHLSITLANDQLDAQIFNTFITILYMYMFRAISCSSSGCQIVLIQHLVSSLCTVSDRPVHRLRENSFSTCAPGFRKNSQPVYRTVTY